MLSTEFGGSLDRFEGDDIAVFQSDLVLRHALVMFDGSEGSAELSQRGAATGLFLEQFQANAPAWLVTAVLAGDLVEAASQRLSQAKVVGVDSEHLEGMNRVVEPARQRDFNSNHAFIDRGLFDDAPCVDDAKPLPDPFS